MNLLVPNSPVVPSFGASVGDNAMARLKDVNQVISAVNSITTDGYVPDKGNVTQTGVITTAVTTAAAPAGIITTVSSILAAGSNASFIVNNALVTATSSIQLTVNDFATAGIGYLTVHTIAAGVFSVQVYNIHPVNAFNNILSIHYLIL
jgi:hypothetical protein